MNKRFVLLLIMLLTFPPIAHSVTTVVVQETERVILEPKTTDPDDDKLSIKYTSPLNEKGEWQTKYGDAGEYTTTISVSDGVTDVSEDVLIVVKRKEEPPKIESYTPKQEALSIKEAESINFKISASDLNKDELSYEWLLDDKKVNDAQDFTYSAAYNDAGIHKIYVNVFDGAKTASKEWSINVKNVDVEGLINNIEDITVNENEVIRLKLPDFEKYGLTYSISEPIGSKNEWKTTYKDSGSYEIKVHAEGKGFSGDKIVKVVVNDIDRTPIFEKIDDKILNENEELKITLNANDPDDDEIIYSANDIPQGAKLEGNVFSWKPSYDTVKKEGFVDSLMNKFRALTKNFHVKFIVASKGIRATQNVDISVKDINRAPVLEDIEPITINEGETLKIVPNAYDLDGDKVSLSYSGFIDTDTFKSGFDDAGAYFVKVTASDGLLETSKFVQINIQQSNRMPLFGKIQDIKAREGDNIAILLNAHDPDNDEITYSIENPPEDSSLKGNTFLWIPNFNTTNKKGIKKLNLVFVANDGKAEIRQIAKVEVSDKNRMPKIIDATKSISAKVNEPVLMFVKAVDEDGDELSYTWNFGILEKYKAVSTHQRIFRSRGNKVIKVIVSDGTDEVEQVINVNVV